MEQDKQINEQELLLEKRPVWLIRLLVLLLTASLIFFLVYGALRISGMPALEQLLDSNRLAKDETVARAAQSAVSIRSGHKRGSGFILAPGNLCLTCAHVLDQEAIFVAWGKQELSAEVLALDEDLDLALLQLEEVLDSGLDLANFLPQPHEELIMVGSPFASGRLISRMEYLGPVKVSAYAWPLLALAGPVYQGNSGSPVINHSGLVVGILSATAQASTPEDDPLGLLIPFDLIKDFLGGP